MLKTADQEKRRSLLSAPVCDADDKLRRDREGQYLSAPVCDADVYGKA